MHDVVTAYTHAGRRSDLAERISFPPAKAIATAERPFVAPEENDDVEISAAARDFDDVQAGRVRSSLVERIRAEIADGTYLTDEKLNTAIDRLLGTISAA